MNERIKELIVESGNGQMRDGRLYPHIGIRFEEDWQRFAELIVKECADMVEEHQPRYLTRRQAQEMADTIKQNFGVEE